MVTNAIVVKKTGKEAGLPGDGCGYYLRHFLGRAFEYDKLSVDDKRAVARVFARIARVRQGNLGDYKSVGDGVSELRIDYGPGYRVYFGQEGRRIVILLCGGDKRTQDKDINLAKEYWSQFKAKKTWKL